MPAPAVVVSWSCTVSLPSGVGSALIRTVMAPSRVPAPMVRVPEVAR